MKNNSKERTKLEEEHIKYLWGVLESGIVYQIVKITLKDSRQLKNRVVLDSQFLLLENTETIDADFIKQIKGENR